MKVAGRWRYVYRAVDQYGQIVDVYVLHASDTKAARVFFATALGAHGEPTEEVTDRARTIGSKLTIAGSRPGCDRCVASNAIGL